MDTWMLAIGVALGVIALTLLGVLGNVRSLGTQFSLLDRGQLIPKIRARLWILITIAASLAVLALAVSCWQPHVRARSSSEAAAVQEQLDAAQHRIRELQLQLDSQLNRRAAATETPADPEPAVSQPQPQPAAAAQPPPPAPRAENGGWLRARIVATGEVTLREWPNGRALSGLAPGSELLVSNERKSAGDHEWRRVRLSDGRSGWIVGRFLVVEGS